MSARECREPPSNYLRRFYFDTMVFEPDQLKFLVDRYGAEHVLLGTDYPYDMGDEDPLALIASTPGLTQDQVDLIRAATRPGCWGWHERAERDGIGLAVIGCGAIGRIRAVLAREHPGVRWLGLCDIDEATLKQLATDTEADLATVDIDELLARPEVSAVIIATDESEHVELILRRPARRTAVHREAPRDRPGRLGTGPRRHPGRRCRRGDRLHATVPAPVPRRQAEARDGQIGEVTTVVTRAFMNRMVPEATLRKVTDTTNLTPMVVSGTHSLDMCLWLMEGKSRSRSTRAASTGRSARWAPRTARFGVFTMDDGTVFSMNINWALPTIWPGAVYGLEIGIVGTEGVIDIEDTHRDVIIASEHPQPAGYNSRGFEAPDPRHIDFVGSYPPGDLSDGVLWGPMREETTTWFNRLTTGARTPHASAADGHRNLLLTMAMDLSAKRGAAVSLPISPEDSRGTARRSHREPPDRRSASSAPAGAAGSAPSPVPGAHWSVTCTWPRSTRPGWPRSRPSRSRRPPPPTGRRWSRTRTWTRSWSGRPRSTSITP